MSLSISNRTNSSTPKVRFDKLKDKVLGKEYELSLVFCGSKLSRKLNSTYRDKDKSTNVLSFPIERNFGEIFIDLATTKKEMKNFGMSMPKLVTYLFIHGLLHLKGMSHGDTMEKAEKKILNGATNSSWY